MLRFVGLNYHYHEEFSTPAEVIDKHSLSSGYIHFLKKKVELILVKHLNYEGEQVIDWIRYRFFKSRNRSWYIPFRTHKYIYAHRPNVVLVEGFVFMMQVIALRIKLGRKVKIIAQHHGERPFGGWKGLLQRIADKSIDAYLFASNGNAKEWIDRGIISPDKCHEVMSASTAIKPLDKNACRFKLGMHGSRNFLWVGRLTEKKDPLTVVGAFCEYAITNPDARLYMIYQSEELLERIKALIIEHNCSETIKLVGFKPHDELPLWYSAADFFVSGSHMEGSGYALVEAMACGCVPVITRIPSFTKITQGGKFGLLYEAGNQDDLHLALSKTASFRQQVRGEDIINYTASELSYESISNQLLSLCERLVSR